MSFCPFQFSSAAVDSSVANSIVLNDGVGNIQLDQLAARGEWSRLFEIAHQQVYNTWNRNAEFPSWNSVHSFCLYHNDAVLFSSWSGRYRSTSSIRHPSCHQAYAIQSCCRGGQRVCSARRFRGSDKFSLVSSAVSQHPWSGFWRWGLGDWYMSAGTERAALQGICAAAHGKLNFLLIINILDECLTI